MNLKRQKEDLLYWVSPPKGNGGFCRSSKRKQAGQILHLFYMPLIPGSSDAVIFTNISEMVAAGHPQDQAAAAAYRNAGRHMRSNDYPSSAEIGQVSPQSLLNGSPATDNAGMPMNPEAGP